MVEAADRFGYIKVFMCHEKITIFPYTLCNTLTLWPSYATRRKALKKNEGFNTLA